MVRGVTCGRGGPLNSGRGRADCCPRETALASAEQMLREGVDHVGGSPPQWGFGGPYGRVVRSQGETEAGAVRRRARGAGSQGLGPRRACPRAELRRWPPQLHHACTGPGLSVLCVLRHDVLEHFSVYGTALSMWVSLMGECLPP